MESDSCLKLGASSYNATGSVIIYSDGSSGSPYAPKSHHSSVACLMRIEDKTLKLVGLTCLLSSYEVELLAAIMGLAAFRLVQKFDAQQYGAVRIASDCAQVVRLINMEMSIQQMKQRRKKVFLNEILLSLVDNMQLDAVHVRGHAGNGGNEACHRACAWVNRQSDRLLELYGEGALGQLSNHRPGHAWYMIDLRGIYFSEKSDRNFSELDAKSYVLLKLEEKLLRILQMWRKCYAD